MTAGPSATRGGGATALLTAETHPIVLAAGSRVVASSDGLGWRNLHASITAERRWSGSLAPIDHICFAYCLRQAARIERRIAGESGVRTLALRARQFGILPTRVASSFRLTGSADIMMIYVRGSLVERAEEELYEGGRRAMALEPHVGFCDPLLEQVAMEIAEALERRNAIDDPPYIDQLARTAAAHLLRHHGDLARTSAPAGLRASPDIGAGLARVRAFIAGHLAEDLDTARLARVAGLSPARLSHAFAIAHGETPHQYVIKQRIERARQLLLATDLPIAEVALETGFASQSHLTDAFRRRTGDTPRAYRHGHRGREAADRRARPGGRNGGS